MNITLKITFIIICFFHVHQNTIAQDTWTLKKNEDGISVYTASIAGSTFKAFRAVSNFKETSLTEISSILMDVEQYPVLYPDTRESKLITKKNPAHNIHYLRTAAPWPVDDRDGVYEVNVTYSKSDQRVHVDLKCIRYNYPLQKSVVRMTGGEGYWELKDNGKGAIEATYQFHGEPGGNIPAWLVNSSVISLPFHTMQNLRKMIAGGKYKNDVPEFMK